MEVGPAMNTALFGICVVAGLFAGGFIVEWLKQNQRPSLPADAATTEVEKRQVSVNIAILYATLTLVISSVVSQWPPEGQAILPFVEFIVFYVSVLVTAAIFGRVGRLIYELEIQTRTG